MSRPEIPLSQRTFGESVYWLSVVAAIGCMVGPVIALLAVDSNVMNPHYLFASIFNGNSAEVVWQEIGGGFPGGHFWVNQIFSGDGFTQFSVALGCASALPAMIATALVFMFKKEERSLLWVLISLAIGALITVSMLGLVQA